MAKINDEYDIGLAFEAIENELIASMMRNMERHQDEEEDEKKRWSMWQTEQLKALEQYKKKNAAKYGKQFKDINGQIEEMIRAAKDQGNMDQEIKILQQIKRGFTARKVDPGGTAEFFKLNERKLEALIKATMNDMEKAETAVLRMANDQYRKIIINAQVYANTGAGTYEKAVDMATRDFLAAGLNCVEYANGARHTLADYADMAIRTASKRAYLQGEGEKRQEWGIATVIMNKRGNPCPLCLPFVGKVLMDDVWSGGPKDEISRLTGVKYPLMSKAVEAGLYHPRCRDAHTTYFEGINTASAQADDKAGRVYTREELQELVDRQRVENKEQYARRQEKKYERMAEYSLDPENKQKYAAKQKEWEGVANKAGHDIIEMTRKADDPRQDFKFISDETFENLTIPARKDGAVIIRGTKEAEEHLKQRGAAASNLGDVLIFRKDVCISEVLEETYHFQQNMKGLNNDKGEPLRSILNEIDAKQYLLKNAKKYQIPRNELELTRKQLESYQKQLEEYNGGKE